MGNVKGIRDKVAIIGMGCTKFGEHWDKSKNDLIFEATKELSKEVIEGFKEGYGGGKKDK